MSPVRTGPQRTQRFERRRDQIIEAAVCVLNTKGVKGMTLADVAGKLGLVPTGVIYYFRNKEELAAACFLRAIACYEALIGEAETEKSARGRLTRFFAAYFDYRRRAEAGEAPPIAVFNDVRALDNPTVNEAFVAMFRRIRRLFVAPDLAGLDRADLNARTHLLVSEVFWTVTWEHRHELEDYGRLADRVADILTRGLAAEGHAYAPLTLPPLAEPDDLTELSRERFLRAATELINEQGYLGASVDRISARLNVTKGAFYYHNDDKDDLVAACFERTFEIMRRAIRTGEEAAGDGLTRLATACTALVRHQLAGEAPLLRTSALTSVPEALRPKLLAAFDRISDRLAALISDGVADGSMRPVDVNIAAQMITAMLNASAEVKFFAPSLTPRTAGSAYVRPLFLGLFAPHA